MARFFSNNNINRVILSILLGAFTLTFNVPIQAQQLAIGINEVAFVYRIEKLIEKIWKLEKSQNKDKMYEAIIDLKAELETSCGIKIDLDKHMDNLESELKKKGYKIPRKQFDAIRKAIKKKEKKHSDHSKYLAAIIYLEGYELNTFDEEVMFPEYIAKRDEDKDESKDEEEVYVPAQLVFGVTLTLCGLFLMVVPIPACKNWAKEMVASGVIICGECISGKMDDDKNKDRDKGKK